MRPQIDYFRLKREIKISSSTTFPVGTLVAAFPREVNGQPRMAMGYDSGWSHYFSLEEWEELATPATEQEIEEFSAYLAADHTRQLQDESQASMAELLGGDPPSEVDEVPPTTETTLTTSTSSKFGVLRNKALAITQKANSLRELVELKSTIMRSHAATLQAKLRLDQEIMEAQMTGIKRQMELLNHALDISNLYLGTTERVTPIREGKRAPATTPITIRQRILFMEEECAMLDTKGIDYSKILSFDTYVQNDDLLQLIMPEEKGVVVLKVTRNPIKYEGVDPITQVLLNQENAKTYWLIRNGECLWRFWADYDAPETLFPSQSETHISTHRPGTKEYYQEMQHAEERAESLRFAYLKAGLLLQGILDRTRIFTPFPNNQPPALTDPSTWEGKIRFLYDAEMHLGEGKTPFPEWLREVNKTLLPGQRIVTGYLPRSSDETYFVSPKNASGYNEPKVWTIQRGPKGFYFRFQRTDTIYNGYQERTPERQGTYHFDEDLSTWINFDAAPLEDFEHYLKSREARVHFQEMIPLLKRCQALKEEEAQTEAPFRALLLRDLQTKYGKHSELPQRLETLIRWWKGKQQTWKPLVCGVEETNKAYQEIIAQYSQYQTQGQAPKPEDLPDFLNQNPVLAYLNDPKTVIAYTLMDARFPVFATQKSYQLKKGKWLLAQENPGVAIPPRAKVHPSLFYQHPENFARIIQPIPSQHWKPTQLQEIAKEPLNQIRIEYLGKNQTPLAICYIQQKQAPYEGELAIITANEKGEISQRPLKKAKRGSAYDFVAQYRNGTYSVLQNIAKLQPHAELEDSWRVFTILGINQAECLAAEQLARRDRAKAALKQRKRHFVINTMRALEANAYETWKDQQYRAYLKDGGDPTLFEDHLRTIKVPNFPTDALEFILQEVLFHRGWTIRKLKTQPFQKIKAAAKESSQTRERDFFDRRNWTENEEAFEIPDDFQWPDAKD